MAKRSTPIKAEPRKIQRNYRLFPDTVRRLKIAAEAMGVNETAYVEITLRERFKREGIK